MLIKKAGRALTIALAISLSATFSLFAQGVSNQEYSGLDKYLTQGRQENASFVGVRAAEFLTIPVGARGIAMGNSYTAIADDISATWWNPAGLGFLRQREVMVTVVDYTLDLTYSYVAAAAPIGDGNLVLGGFFGYLNVPELEITTVTQPEGTGNFYRAYDFQMGGSMAYNFSDRFIGGINLKYVHQDVWNNLSADAFAIDAGAMYHAELMDREIKFSFMIQNLGTNMTMDGSNLRKSVGPEDSGGSFPDGYSDYTKDPYSTSKKGNRILKIETHTYRLPTTVKIALGYNAFTSEKANLLVSGELARPNYIPISYSVGAEFNYNFNHAQSAALRIGWLVQSDEYTNKVDQFSYDYYGDDPTLRGLSLGGGLQRNFLGKVVRFDYAYRNKGRLSADNFFTISFGF
ncbi:MAG TPA: PorV/PorQ family protein [archaeon]|nr:PorV/PorQ family protein [archaeon]